MYTAIVNIAEQSFLLFAVMAPYLLLGIVAAGVLHVLLPVDFVSKRLGQNNFASVFKAGALGVPIPLCSCGVVPVAASLSKNGASKGATVSFLVTTPTSGVDSMFATYSLLGWPIMVLRVLASFLLGILAGGLTALVDRTTTSAKPNPVVDVGPQGARIPAILKYAFFELYEGISKPLLIGSLLGGAIATFLPAEILTEYVGDGFMAYLVMLGIGIPLYVCASGSIPLAAALLAKGISPGAAIIFLIAGPATNAATVAVISNMLGKKTLFIYLAVLLVGTLAAGVGADFLFSTVALPLPHFQHMHRHGEGGLGWFEIGTAIGLLGFSAYFLVMPLIRKWRAPKGVNMIELTVNDMTCGHCAKNIETAVCDIEGVQAVHANPDSKKVIIDADSAMKPTLAEAIQKAGYTPEG